MKWKAANKGIVEIYWVICKVISVTLNYCEIEWMVWPDLCKNMCSVYVSVCVLREGEEEKEKYERIHIKILTVFIRWLDVVILFSF